MNIFFTSDTHFYHRNIARGTSSWKSGYRDFDDHKIMSKTIIDNINARAKKDDVIYHLGDFALTNILSLVNSRLAINCDNIIYCFGNHDNEIIKNKRIPNGLLEKVDDRFPDATHLQDLFNEVTFKKQLRVDGTLINMQHFAQRVWDESHRGSIQLHGHSHSALEGKLASHPINEFYNKYKTLDVGIDNAYRLFGEYRMFTFDEVMEIMNNRKERLVFG